MIIGIGTDVVSIERFSSAIERHGNQFLELIFTSDELAENAGKKKIATHLAARFAAKEAALKALGTGVSRGITFKDVIIHRKPESPPQLTFLRTALELSDKMGVTKPHLSLSHDANLATAFVILEG